MNAIVAAVETRQLELFLAVAEERSFTRAATRLHVVQSAVSASIKALERELGVSLFMRSSRSVSLTAEGAELVPVARRAVAALDEARDMVAGFRGTVRGRVAFGLLAAPDFLEIPQLLRTFRDSHPEVSVLARTSPSGAGGLVSGLLDESLDLSLVVLPLPAHPDVEFEPLLGGEYVFAAAADHPLALSEAIDPSELDAHGLVTMLRGFSLRGVLDEQLALWGVRAEVRIEVSDVSTMTRCIVAGLGVGLIPRYVVEAIPSLVRLDFGPMETNWAAALATKRGRRQSAAARALIDLIRAEVPLAAERIEAVSVPMGT